MQRKMTVRSVLGALVVFAIVAAGCTSDGGGDAAAPSERTKATGEFATDLDLTVDLDEPTAEATFTVEPGTEEVTVTGVEPEDRLSLIDAEGNRLGVLRADRYGQVHFAYLPTQLAEFQTGGSNTLPTSEGYTVQAGAGYTIRNESTDPVERSEPFDVLGRDDHPEPAWYDDQIGAIGPDEGEEKWFGYITMRDGVQLSATVRLPGPPEEGPYPTVVEYSGYATSNPAEPEPGSLIASLLGYATVGVNMRGSGCSGGAFDVFNLAQQVDGYDIVEAVARQPWVEHQKVGMIGLSYSGITQLYVAATRPPSLAAVTPLSVIKDPWLQQWQGGVYNGGFTRQWLAERDAASAADGSTWVAEMTETDETCAGHQQLREQNVDFEAFGRSLVHRPELADERDLSKLVDRIEVPVYLTGAWQDEQTGPQFADMLGNFTGTDVARFTMFNGRHPDGYSPLVLTRWVEFLDLFVAREVPRISDALRANAPATIGAAFGAQGLGFEPDRYADIDDGDLDGALARFEAEPAVRVLFENGAGDDLPGNPVATFEVTYDSWPPAGIEERSFFLDDGSLVAEPGADGTDTFANDVESGTIDFFDDGYPLLARTWDFDWQPFPEGTSVAYVSAPFDEDVVLAGPGYAEVWFEVPDGDADVQATLSVIRPGGTEWSVTSGLLRLSDRAIDEERSTGLQIERTYALADNEPMPAGELVPVKVALPSFAQAFREGDRLRLVISSPGRDFGAWLFETTGEDGAERTVGRGASTPSRLVLGVLPGIDEVPSLDAPCPSLRGQACRTYAGP